MTDDHIETMSMTSVASEAPIEADKYDLQFDINEEEKILTKIKGLQYYFKNKYKIMLYKYYSVISYNYYSK